VTYSCRLVGDSRTIGVGLENAGMLHHVKVGDLVDESFLVVVTDPVGLEYFSFVSYDEFG